MMQLTLNGAWQMRRADATDWLPATVPGTAYGDLLAAGAMEDPFWRDNENAAFELMRSDFVYQRTFCVDAALLACERVELRCDGLDTLATLFLNGVKFARADNMHRLWRFDVKALLHTGENTLEIVFSSPVNAAEEAFRQNSVEGSSDATRGFNQIRKAHSMYGWDWGPRLPDCGVWRSICLEGYSTARIVSVRLRQTHADGRVTLAIAPELERVSDAPTHLRYTLISPDGEIAVFAENRYEIAQPRLWWPNELGEHPLYTFRAELTDERGDVLDVWERRIGLRTLTVRREKDEWGESFAFVANGVPFF